jgi:hypothetical protein
MGEPHLKQNAIALFLNFLRVSLKKQERNFVLTLLLQTHDSRKIYPQHVGVLGWIGLAEHLWKAQV